MSKLDKAMKPLRHRIKTGDIMGMSASFENDGVPALRQLAKSTNNPCLKRVFRYLAELDLNISKQLKQIESAHDAKVIVCNILEFKAKLFKSCNK